MRDAQSISGPGQNRFVLLWEDDAQSALPVRISSAGDAAGKRGRLDREGSAPPRMAPPPRPPRQQSKRTVEIWAITPLEIVRGNAHCLDGQRMSDTLNDVVSTTLRGP